MQRTPETPGRLPQPRAVEVDHGVALARRRHGLGQLLPGRQHITGLPQRQLQHQRAEGLLEAAHLLRRGQPGLPRHPDGAQPADGAERAPLPPLGMTQRVQRDRRVAGAARPAAQRDLLGHRAGREERGGLRAEQAGDPLLQGSHDPVAVHVTGLVQVVDVGCVLVEVREPVAKRCAESRARQDALRLPVSDRPPLAEALLCRLLVALVRRVCHAPDDAVPPRA